MVSNIVRNSSLWSDVVFEKEVIFHEFDFVTSSLEFGVSKSSIRKHTTSCDKGVFFHYYLATSTTDWAQIFTGLLFYAYVGIHQLWRLVPIVSSVFKFASWITCDSYSCFLQTSGLDTSFDASSGSLSSDVLFAPANSRLSRATQDTDQPSPIYPIAIRDNFTTEGTHLFFMTSSDAIAGCYGPVV